MGAFDDPSILDAATFAFFKGVNTAAVNGQLTADVTAGLPAGNYRLASINTDANHAPAVAAVAQHGFLDDMVYVRFIPLTSPFKLTSLSSLPYSKLTLQKHPLVSIPSILYHRHLFPCSRPKSLPFSLLLQPSHFMEHYPLPPFGLLTR